MKFNEKKEYCLTGLGFILYSDGAVAHIKEGEDYLEAHFWDGSKVVQSTNEGKIIGVSSQPGDFIFEFREGGSTKEEWESYDIVMPLSIEIKGGRLLLDDLYSLMDWTSDDTYKLTIELEDGLYSILLLSNVPESNILGDNQEVIMYIEKDEDALQLEWYTLPSFDGENIWRVKENN